MFVPTKRNNNKMKNFESHTTFENREMKVEINFFGLEKITEKTDNASRVQNCNVTDSLKYWTKYFRSERQIVLNGYPTITEK